MLLLRFCVIDLLSFDYLCVWLVDWFVLFGCGLVSCFDFELIYVVGGLVVQLVIGSCCN